MENRLPCQCPVSESHDSLNGSRRGKKPGRSIFSHKRSKEPLNNDKQNGYLALGTQERQANSQSWKPASLKSVVLIPTILITGGLIILLALLLWKSRRDGGILFAENIDDLPTVYSFMYLYLPTLLAVMYSTLWSWIDLDVKRLEPFFQLSKSCGAAAADSVLLHYPVDFLAAVPIRAAKRKQWAVVCAGTVMMVVFWIVTPLQSAIFASSSITKSARVPMATSHSLMPVSSQAKGLTTGFLRTTYGVLWLDQPLPAFTTREGALTPFEAQYVAKDLGQNVTWSSSTVQYSTDLACRPAVWTLNPKTSEIVFDNKKGCRTSNIFLEMSPPYPITSGRFSAFYIGWFYNGYLDYFLSGHQCPRNASHNFLAIWQKRSFDAENRTLEFTSLFCEPSYYSQEVNANISLPDLSVLSVSPVGPKKVLSDEEFDRTHFEYILSTGVREENLTQPAVQEPEASRVDLPEKLILGQSARLGNWSSTPPVTNMVAFAVAASRFLPEEYLKPDNLAAAYQAAHRVSFAVAINSIMVSSNESTSVKTGWRASQMDAVFLSSIFTIIVQAALLIVLAMTVYLLVVCRRRHSCLSSNPSSITSVMSLSRDPGLLYLLRNLDEADSATFKKELQQHRFQLQYSEKTHGHILGIATPPRGVSGTAEGKLHLKPFVTALKSKSVKTKARPVELSLPVGLIFISLLASFIAILTVLKYKIDQQNGLPLPSDTFLVQQLLLNYLPTSIATLIEPFWVVLNRLLCLFQPFDQLRRANAPPSVSLNLRYSSIPPQLVFWRALRARHFQLAAVCSVALLSNVLTIALSALFNQSFVYLSDGLLLRQLRVTSTEPDISATWLKSGITMEPFYVADSNITASTPLPAWVTPDHYFVPFELPPTTNKATNYQAITTAVRAELSCEPMHKSQGRNLFNLTLNNNATGATLATSHYQPDGGVIRCHREVGWGGNPEGRNAAEVLTPMAEFKGSETDAASVFCRAQIVAGWVRSNITLEARPINNTVLNSARKPTSVSMDYMFMVCRPRLSNSTFAITVDSSGVVLDSRPVDSIPSTANITGLFSLSDGILNTILEPSTKEGMCWHNDTLAADWPNYLIKQLARSPAILDAHAPVPLFAPTAALFSSVYSRTFAILVSLNTVWSLPPAPISPNSTVTTVAAQAITGHWRIFMNPTLFKLAITILSLDLAVAAWLYAARPKVFLPRMPTSLASVIAFFAAGNVVEDLKTERAKGGGAVSVDEQMRHFEQMGWRFGYGKLFPDKDGRRHMGIERVPFFEPLHNKNAGSGTSGGLRRRLKMIWRPAGKG